MTPEGKVKRAFKQLVDGLVKEGFPIWGFMPVSLGMGVHGIPDWVGVVRGKFLAIEFKAGSGTTTERQKYIHGLIKRAGGVVLVIDELSIHDVENILVHFAG